MRLKQTRHANVLQERNQQTKKNKKTKNNETKSSNNNNQKRKESNVQFCLTRERREKESSKSRWMIGGDAAVLRSESDSSLLHVIEPTVLQQYNPTGSGSDFLHVVVVV